MVDAAHGARQGRTKVSAIIPCHDGELYVADAIRSVLGQNYDPLEIIVVDDGSTDRSAEAVAAFGDAVRCVRQPHGGASLARNRGVELATGQVVAFLDADDLWPDDVLPRLIAVLEGDPSVGMVVGHVQQFVSPELPDAVRLAFRFAPDPVPARLFGSVFVRRSEFDRVGPFSPRLASGELMDWVMRAEELGVKSVTVPDVVLKRRLHRVNHGIVRRHTRLDYVRVVKAALDRRRIGAAGQGSS